MSFERISSPYLFATRNLAATVCVGQWLRLHLAISAARNGGSSLSRFRARMSIINPNDAERSDLSIHVMLRERARGLI